uniref:WW domain-containing protein n=1 Tax=Mesocestoides corti TaxID=53468 RepID=A0A5K3EZX7_MESCO
MIRFRKVITYFISVPTTSWIVQVDPKTNLPFYYNFLTKESTWDIPDDYQAYLEAYEVYLQRNKGKKKDDSDMMTQIHIMPEGNARKRRRIRRAWMRSEEERSISGAHHENAPIEFLSEYIAYSSSSSDNDSSCSRSPDRSRSPESMADVSSVKNEEPVPQLESVFIGPQLPPPLQKESTVTNLHDLSQLLLDKFAVVDPEHDKLSSLQVAYLQFTTRLEDWKAGYLSEERYKEKLQEVNNFLCDYEQSSLPSGWRCVWDPENKRYIYKSSSFPSEQYQRPPVETNNACPIEPTCSIPVCQTSVPENGPDPEIHLSENDNTDNVRPQADDATQMYEPTELDGQTTLTLVDTSETFLCSNSPKCDLESGRSNSAKTHEATSKDIQSETIAPDESMTDSASGQVDLDYESGVPTEMANSPATKSKRKIQKMDPKSEVLVSKKDMPNLLDKWQKVQESL